MTSIIRTLEEIEKEGFSHMKGALKTVLTTQQNILALKQKIKNIIQFLKENILQLLTQVLCSKQVICSKHVQGTWHSLSTAFILEAQGRMKELQWQVSLVPETGEPALVMAVNCLCQGCSYGTPKSAAPLWKQRKVDTHKHPSLRDPDGSSMKRK